MDDVLTELAPSLKPEHLLVSIAAGYPIERMENIVGADRRIVRVMPNTPSKVGEGASPYCLNKNATEEDSRTMALLLGSVGVAMEVQENQLDAVTGVSGSGPAYIFLAIESLADGAVKMGIPRDVAKVLAA